MVGVSVVIPVYKKEEYLNRAIMSILNQRFNGDIEIIIVWDDPKDLEPTVKLFRKCEKNNIDCKIIINAKKTNPARARNTGVDEAGYNYIFFLDSDDFFTPEKINNQLKLMKNNNIGLSYTDFIIINKSGNHMKNIIVPDESKIKNYWIPNKICTSSVCVKKKYFNSVGGFDTSFEVCEDLDLWIRLYNVCKFKKLNGFYTYYTSPEKSIKRRLLFDKYRIKVFLKNRMPLYLLRAYSIYARGLIRWAAINMTHLMKNLD